jgi:hypothetical protein
MTEIAHPTIKGGLSKIAETQFTQVDFYTYRWLVPRDFRHVAWAGYDPEGESGHPPREEQISGRSYFRIERPWHSSGVGQRHSMHRA